MTIHEYIAAFGFFIEIVGGFYAYFELSATFALLKGHGKIMQSYKHTIEHIFTLSLMIVCNLSLVFWLLLHKGFSHAWQIHIIGEYFWIVIFLFGVLKIAIAKHLRNERLDSYSKTL